MTTSAQSANDPLSAHAQALLNATSDVVGDKVGEARERLSAALEGTKKIYGQVKEQVIDGAKSADKVVRNNPYIAIGVAVGVGALIGFLVSRRCSRCDK